jgi:hypothetical protein
MIFTNDIKWYKYAISRIIHSTRETKRIIIHHNDIFQWHQVKNNRVSYFLKRKKYSWKKKIKCRSIKSKMLSVTDSKYIKQGVYSMQLLWSASITLWWSAALVLQQKWSTKFLQHVTSAENTNCLRRRGPGLLLWRLSCNKIYTQEPMHKWWHSCLFSG